ncbi:non-lysosomal glucosylceramidase [Niabella pedocola]|uniref:Non-lysosomal glucosylceramidase n=1 Tax=Niabella pedocola TaxID=1752077 RepID=A0ABS8PWB7_9BACT|nr:GH116 family glycosyl hydrolase [Niabella pedocola]MCD2425371.1 non-lysosomal glucosylceramidase [Niabella pedocola]
MSSTKGRRSFIKKVGLGSLAAVTSGVAGAVSADSSLATGLAPESYTPGLERAYNGVYTGEYLNRVAFPIGGLGAGMFCLEGTGAISHMSINNRPEVFFEPNVFAALCVKGPQPVARVLEGPVPEWKIFGQRGTGNGASGTSYGLPRFGSASFQARFPFATIQLEDPEMPLKATLTGWSPFIPGDEDNSGLPAGALEYTFTNRSSKTVEAVFSYNARNFVARGERGRIQKMDNGFILSQEPGKEKPFTKTDFAVYTTTDQQAVVDYCWFRGGWFDPLTMIWNTIESGSVNANPPVEWDAPGASLFVPLTIAPGAQKTVRVMMAWYVPESDLRIQEKGPDGKEHCNSAECCISPAESGLESYVKFTGDKYKPWYASRFNNVQAVAAYWMQQYAVLKRNSIVFRDAFYNSTLPAEVIEAVAANLTILKSPTVLRQYDGRMWAWEGCGDDNGCCHGTCTHVWNYAQAVCHLFPKLEIGLRNTEFCEDQSAAGHQTFRANMPISPVKHDFHAAADGQLGGIMKVHREWRIHGNTAWLKKIYPLVKRSLDYCIETWDPLHKGVLEEPHHNTYDIEFWGADAMCTTFYLGALQSIIAMGHFLKDDVASYKSLLEKGKAFLEDQLYNGEFFFQKIQWEGLKAKSPAEAQSFGGAYSKEAVEILKKEGPKYQYGRGCLSDGVLGSWIAAVCGLEDPVDPQKISSHLLSVHRYNLKKNLKGHVNPQRPAYALGSEGGLLLCTWPKGGKLSLPFVYSNEVWTGIEYQVAAHLMMMGKVKEGLDIVRACRNRYNGKVRNPFNEYECGHWYARAMSSYGMLQGLTGLRYDAVDKTIYIRSRVGDFTSFLSTATGFGTVTYRNKKASLKVVHGTIDVSEIRILA